MSSGKFAIYCCLTAAFICASLYVATFVTFVALLVPLGRLFSDSRMRNPSESCVQAWLPSKIENCPRAPPKRPGRKLRGSLVYSVFTFACVYKVTGGTNGLTTVNGQYVAMD